MYIRALNPPIQLPPLRALITRIGSKFNVRAPVYLNDHYARDIGLEPGNGPIGKIELPSQVWSHPRL